MVLVVPERSISWLMRFYSTKSDAGKRTQKRLASSKCSSAEPSGHDRYSLRLHVPIRPAVPLKRSDLPVSFHPAAEQDSDSP